MKEKRDVNLTRRVIMEVDNYIGDMLNKRNYVEWQCEETKYLGYNEVKAVIKFLENMYATQVENTIFVFNLDECVEIVFNYLKQKDLDTITIRKVWDFIKGKNIIRGRVQF